MSASTPGDIPQNVYYMQSSEIALGDAVALSTDVCTSYLSVDGTDAFTLAAPVFKGQIKVITTIAGANSPIAAVTVTGMRVAAQNVFSGFGPGAVATTPATLVLHSPDGVAWNIWSMTAAVTVA